MPETCDPLFANDPTKCLTVPDAPAVVSNSRCGNRRSSLATGPPKKELCALESLSIPFDGESFG